MSELVSIVIPIYKISREMLTKCIESCINQTWKDIEIILVDDESPDDCGKICDQYMRIDKRIKVIHQKNKGLSGARNTGVKESTGKWVMFVDGDDYIDLNMCEKMIKSIKNQSVEIICCSYIRKSGKHLVKCKLEGLEPREYRNEECKLLQEKVLEFNSHFSTAYCKLIKREFLIKNNIFHNEKLKQGAEGIEFNIRVFEKIKVALIVDEFLYYYVYNENSISNKHDEKNHYYVLNCFETIKENINKSKNKQKLLQLFYNRIGYVVVTTAISGYFSPTNKEDFKMKKRKYKEYLNQPLVKETMRNIKFRDFDNIRKIILLLIKLKCFRVINLLAIVRRKTK